MPREVPADPYRHAQAPLHALRAISVCGQGLQVEAEVYLCGLRMSSIILKKVPKGSILRSHDIGRVVQELEALDEGKTWKVSFEEYKSERSDLQNNYYHGVVLEMIAKAWGVETEEAHEWLCGTRWGWKDKKVPKTPRNPDGIESVPRRTTTMGFDGKRSVLKKMEFEEFVEFARRFASKKLQLYIPDPDKNYRLNRERQEQAA